MSGFRKKLEMAYIKKPIKGKCRPLAGIVDSFGISAKVVPEDCEILGEALGKTIVFPSGKPAILISARLSTDEQRLVFAHEFSHLLLGHLLPMECYHVSGKQAEFEAETLGLILYHFLYGANSTVEKQPERN